MLRGADTHNDPVAIPLYRVAGRRSSGLNGTSLLWTIVGVVAFGSVGLLRLVAMMDSAVSDILFMLPLGFVGLWLVAANWKYLPILGPGLAGKQIQPEGLKGSEMDARQQAMLFHVIAQWAGIVNDSYAKTRMAEIKADLNDTWFAWSDPTTHATGKNGTSYYRIQGPKLVIEFYPQGVGGDPAMQVHTIYRDPTNDYGVKLTETK